MGLRFVTYDVPVSDDTGYMLLSATRANIEKLLSPITIGDAIARYAGKHRKWQCLTIYARKDHMPSRAIRDNTEKLLVWIYRRKSKI
jgi:hypothetical protein